MTAQIIPFIPQDAIIFNHDQIRTTSLKVAEAFGKQHKHVAEKLRTVECSEQFLTDNFSAVKFTHRGNEYDAWEMTKDGFMFLVMGFTGKKAAQVKEAYIKAFNEMAEQLRLPAPNLKTKTALPNGLTLDQCDAVKALVKARAESCPKEKQAGATIKCWSSIKSKFGCSYKEIAPEYFLEALSLVARIELEGEYIAREELPPIDVAAVLGERFGSGPLKKVSPEVKSVIERKSLALAFEAMNYFHNHLTMLASECAQANEVQVQLSAHIEKKLGAVTLGSALAYKQHIELTWVAQQAANMRVMAADLEQRLKALPSAPFISLAS